MRRASNTPPRNVVAVATIAHTKVHPKTGKNVPAKSPVKTLAKAWNPVHEKAVA